jgi:hypothetical protein
MSRPDRRAGLPVRETAHTQQADATRQRRLFHMPTSVAITDERIVRLSALTRSSQHRPPTRGTGASLQRRSSGHGASARS